MTLNAPKALKNITAKCVNLGVFGASVVALQKPPGCIPLSAALATSFINQVVITL